MQPPRVLLIAEAANPEWTSVPLVGWSHARALMQRVDGHLVTQVRNREAIEKNGLSEGERLTTIDSEVVAKPLWNFTEGVRKVTGLGWTFGTAMSTLPYYYFEQQLWKRFGAAIRSGQYDIVHRITPLSPTIPSIIVRRCARARVPFVLGPLNGGIDWPPGFTDLQRGEGEWLNYVREAHRLLPGYGQTRRYATALIVGSRATFAQLPRHCLERAVYIPENAIDPSRFNLCVQGPVRVPLRVAFVGRLVALKGVDMLIDASTELIRAGKLCLDIIGDGPERDKLAGLIRERGLDKGVKLEGWVEHRKLAERLVQSDVFGFPSVHEFGGGVVLEAMALGLVPVVADYAGPAELVTEQTGYRVSVSSRPALIAGFRRVLERLVQAPEELRQRGLRARERVMRLFTWSAKAEQTLEVYRWVLGEQGKPDFGMPFGDLAYGSASSDSARVGQTPA